MPSPRPTTPAAVATAQLLAARHAARGAVLGYPGRHLAATASDAAHPQPTPDDPGVAPVGPSHPIPDLPAVFASPGHLQPRAIVDQEPDSDGGHPPTVWLIIDHAHGRCLGFHATRAVADAWARFYVFNDVVSREQCSVQGCTLHTEPPDGHRRADRTGDS